jgi:hypothetical protein
MLLERDFWVTGDGFLVIRVNKALALFTNTREAHVYFLTLRRLFQHLALILVHQQLLIGIVPNEIGKIRGHICLDSELVPASPYIMACKVPTFWTRMTSKRNLIAERVAKHLHFVVPEEGIYGEAVIANAPPLSCDMSHAAARELLSNIPIN